MSSFYLNVDICVCVCRGGDFYLLRVDKWAVWTQTVRKAPNQIQRFEKPIEIQLLSLGLSLAAEKWRTSAGMFQS